MVYAMVESLGIPYDKIISVPPTKLKAKAREYLPPDVDRTDGKKKVKMDKKLIIKAAEHIHPEVLEGLVTSSNSVRAGKEDISDAIFAYYCALETLGGK